MTENRRRTLIEARAEAEGMTAEEYGASLEKNGLACPFCGCRDLRVFRTRPAGRVIRRERVCRHCGRKFMTTEAPI